MSDDATRLEALRRLQGIDPGDGLTRAMCWIWKQADRAKTQLAQKEPR